MLFIVYKTTNLINDKIYIGAHKVKGNLEDDPYLGTGTLITKAIKKYGRENFKREVLYTFDNIEEMYAKEKELVNEEFLSQSNIYNICGGGYGPSILSKTAIEKVIQSNKRRKGEKRNPYTPHSTEANKKKSERSKGIPSSEETKRKISEGHKGKKKKKHSAEANKKKSERLKGVPRSEETVKKISEGLKGKVSVKYANDLYGETLLVSVQDERYISGELISTKKAHNLKKKIENIVNQ